MSDLQRYGLEWKSSTDFICHPMDDGYWTPWHIANNEIDALRKQLNQNQADLDRALARVAELESAGAKAALHWSDAQCGFQSDELMEFRGVIERSTGSFMLRKQAEAIDKFAECLSGTRNKRLASSEANGLRFKASIIESKADQLENIHD